MMASSLTPRPEVTIADLVELGFTEDQIEALKALRACYPFVEYVDTATQWRRLQFLKWRIDQGHLQRL
ncbi:MAG TPA: hypothetical protein DEU95_03970 [Chloroflexi bacterium]|jgi:hypothetical protein|nr:hypothetical protein [Chloroflexota bacterium]HBY47656.1 hypothetical protein [Chloroflexota bacterium]HCG28901.1 hypothetical protein [Chloroflexota bacterium]